MKAAVLRSPGVLEVVDIPEPSPRPGEALLQVRACGICGSDLRYLAGDNPWARHTLGEHRPNPPNMVLGHEVAGIVAEAAGERRCSVLAFRTCGRCRLCRTDRENLCPHTEHLGHGAGWEGYEYNPGGMAERMAVWGDKLYELPCHVSFEDATLLDGLGVAVHAVRRSGLRAGDAALVLGGGPIGLLILQVCRAFGARQTILVDVYRKPLEVGEQVGADVVLHAGEDDVVEAALARTERNGAEAVFDTTGSAATQRRALGVVAKGGTLVLLGGAAAGLELDDAFLSGERTVTSSSNNRYADYQTGLDLLTSGQVIVGPLVTHVFPLRDARHAFDVAAHKQQHGALKVVITP
jgi:threonine dehydrogenase-like Zn-dependent dehydrogenase